MTKAFSVGVSQKGTKVDDLPGRLHDASTKRRTAAVEKVRELAGQGLSMDQISEATGYCRATVKKYLKPDFEPSLVSVILTALLNFARGLM